MFNQLIVMDYKNKQPTLSPLKILGNAVFFSFVGICINQHLYFGEEDHDDLHYVVDAVMLFRKNKRNMMNRSDLTSTSTFTSASISRLLSFCLSTLGAKREQKSDILSSSSSLDWSSHYREEAAFLKNQIEQDQVKLIEILDAAGRGYICKVSDSPAFFRALDNMKKIPGFSANFSDNEKDILKSLTFEFVEKDQDKWLEIRKPIFYDCLPEEDFPQAIIL